ncbi:MAG: acyltransferase [Campylobacterales bacterium]
MLGTLRFLLAVAVMLSHLPYSHFPEGFNLAVTAVVLFYFISGFLMYESFSRTTGGFYSRTLQFFKKRFFRIYPLYWVVLLFTFGELLLFPPSKLLPLLNQPATLEKFLWNFPIFFNNYVFPPLTLPPLLPHPVIPPTWSLGSELLFYLSVPFLWRGIMEGGRGVWIPIFLSVGIQLGAFFIETPLFNSDNFGYRYIFGVWWIFGFGFLYSHYRRFTRGLKLLYFGYLTLLLFSLWYFSQFPFVREIWLGVAIAPVVKLLRNLPPNRWNRLLGSLSYPLFLVHFPTFYLVEGMGISNPVVYPLLSIFLTILFSYFLASLDKIFRGRKN